MNDESTLFELLPAYALGALSDEERAQVEGFLATSEAARTELRHYQAMLTGYATLAPARKAPSHLTDEFRRRLAAEATTDREPTPPKPTPVARPFPVRRLLAGLAALLIVAFGVFAFYSKAKSDQEAQLIQSILKTPGAKWITLNSPNGTLGKVWLCTVQDRTQAVLIVDHLPDLPYDKQYQLWLADAQGRDNGGVFSADQPVKQVLVNMPSPPSRYKRLGITVEPRGGSPGPTSPAVFTGEFPQ